MGKEFTSEDATENSCEEVEAGDATEGGQRRRGWEGREKKREDELPLTRDGLFN